MKNKMKKLEAIRNLFFIFGVSVFFFAFKENPIIDKAAMTGFMLIIVAFVLEIVRTLIIWNYPDEI